MDLIKIRPLYFREDLEELESQAITVRKRRNDGIVRGIKAFGAGVGTASLGLTAVIAATWFLGVLLGPWAGLTVLMLGTCGVGWSAAGVVLRYLEPSDRRLLPAILEPDAAEFLEKNRERRERLLAEAASFNQALEAFKRLPERTGEDEIDAGVAANLAERRKRFEGQAEAYFAEFRAATEAERIRVAAENAPRKSLVDPHRQSLLDFKREVRLLAALERSLDGFAGADLAPYLAAQRYRAELEEKREALIRLGLKPKKLPKLRIDRKFLPPAT